MIEEIKHRLKLTCGGYLDVTTRHFGLTSSSGEIILPLDDAVNNNNYHVAETVTLGLIVADSEEAIEVDALITSIRCYDDQAVIGFTVSGQIRKA